MSRTHTPGLLSHGLLATCLGLSLAWAGCLPALAGDTPDTTGPSLASDEPVAAGAALLRGRLGFASPEHEYLGSLVTLRMPEGRGGPGDRVVLLNARTSDGSEVPLSYADVLYLAGDFYAVPYARVGDGMPFDSAWSPRSEAATVAFRRDLLTLFHDAYVDDLPRLRELELALMQRFRQAREQGRALDYTLADECAFMRATGAEACIESVSDLPRLNSYLGRYLELASRGQDHFEQNAQTTFLVGQRLALQQALRARDEADLTRAYLTAAYAAHFASDAFAAGHVRTDKQAIDTYCSGRFVEAPLGGYLAQLLSGVLVKHMHDQENRDGLTLVGRDGRRWTAHGDNYLSLPGNEAEIQAIVRTLQLAADQVFDAYQRRGRVDETGYVEQSLAALRATLPDIVATRDVASGNPPPLFDASRGGVIWNDPQGASAPLDCDAALWRYAGELRSAAPPGSAPGSAPAGPAAASAGAAPGSAAARSIDVTVSLAESSYGAASPQQRRMTCDWGRIDHGDFPASGGHFTSEVTAHLESNGAATGAEGELNCLVMTPDLRGVSCQFSVHYDNPFVGSDAQSLTRRSGACTVELDDAGRGDNWHPRVLVR